MINEPDSELQTFFKWQGIGRGYYIDFSRTV